MSEPSIIACSRCGASIATDELTAGLAVRVDGNLVCHMCVDSLPEKAVIRINQMRALKGLEAKTYSVIFAKAPHTQLYSFTTAANITQHRRTLARDGFFEAPPLPAHNKIPSVLSNAQQKPPDQNKIVTDRVAREVKPGAKIMLIAALGTAVLLIGIVVALSLFVRDKNTATPTLTATPTPKNDVPAAPAATLIVAKSRLDYPVSALEAWNLASQDRDCPINVRQAIALELIDQRQRALDLADNSLNAQQFDAVDQQLPALTLPDDIVFRAVREREIDLRQRLAALRERAAAPIIPAPLVPPPNDKITESVITATAPTEPTIVTSPPVDTPANPPVNSPASAPSTATPETAPTTPITANAPKNIVTVWQGKFISTGRDKLPQVLAIDGRDYIPDGWYGGVPTITQASRIASLKRYGAYADIKKLSLTDGGVAVLVHPLRLDRKSLSLYVTNEAGVTQPLGVINFSTAAWTPAIFTLPTASSFDASSIITLGIEDVPSDNEFPDNNGFLIGKIALVSGRAPTTDDLAIRPSALMPDENRNRNVGKLLTAAARARKRTEYKRAFEWEKTRFVYAEKIIALPNVATTMKSFSRIAPVITTLTLNDNWLDTMTKGRGAPLDPSTTHIAVIWTAGEETLLSADANELAQQFFKKRLEQMIDAGIIPVLVIGPNCQSEPRRSVCEKAWSNLAQLPPIRLMSVPVIDLRALTTADDGSMDDKTQVLAAHLINDALKEIEYQFRRLGALK
jgi:hypothetical protein